MITFIPPWYSTKGDLLQVTVYRVLASRSPAYFYARSLLPRRTLLSSKGFLDAVQIPPGYFIQTLTLRFPSKIALDSPSPGRSNGIVPLNWSLLMLCGCGLFAVISSVPAFPPGCCSPDRSVSERRKSRHLLTSGCSKVLSGRSGISVPSAACQHPQRLPNLFR